MKRTILFSGLILALVVLTSNATAAVWRVNGAAGSAADFATIQAAHNAASVGDTLYIEGSAISAGSLTCTKPLVIIGSGYFLSQNPQTQAAPVSGTVDYIYFNAGSAGSKVMGITVGYIYIYTNDIFITRNYFSFSSYYAIYAPENNLSNIIITQNYIGSSSVYGYAVYFPYAANNILISNNYIHGYLNSGSNFYGIITNNIVHGYIGVYNSTLKNNILYWGGFTNYNCVYEYNIGYDASFGTANGNQSNVSMANVFEGTTGTSTDGQWKLRTGSPAIGAGENGVDCGMYGGPFPYILSGMPNIPSVYYFLAPAIPSNTLDVAIKAKSHN
ncbi:MAG TPA: hypothetical protein P5550_01645 [Bacteroidales bacterium]|nr:hypothetical protein [Bacteroidales bacterium]